MADLFGESIFPWIVIAVLVDSVFVSLYAAKKKPIFLIAAAVAFFLTLGIGVKVTKSIVTDREVITQTLHDGAKAVEGGDLDQIRSFIVPESQGPLDAVDRHIVNAEVSLVELRDIEIEINDLTSPPQAHADFRVFVEIMGKGDAAGMKVRLNFPFSLELRKEGERWLVFDCSEVDMQEAMKTMRPVSE
jgi:hypothetical protein